MKRSKIARRIEPNRRIQFPTIRRGSGNRSGLDMFTPPVHRYPTCRQDVIAYPLDGSGIEPFQLMMNAKGLPTEEFADYTFVFR